MIGKEYPAHPLPSINIGDIIIVEKLEFVKSHTQQAWKLTNNNEWSKVRRAWRVDDITNNGKIKAHDGYGKKNLLIHAMDKAPCTHYIVRVVAAT